MDEINIKSGKTFRYIWRGNKMDTSIVLNTKNPDENVIDLLGYEFKPGLTYSMKKKQRWRLQSMILNNYHDEEYPIVYTKHQCLNSNWAVLDLFAYDSLSELVMGSSDVTNLKLGNRPINISSVINQLENKDDYTKQEKKSFEKSQKQKIKNNDACILDDVLQPKLEHAHNKEQRQNCIYFSEYVHMLDISKQNMINPYNYRRWRSSRTKKTSKIVNLSDSENDYDNEESEDENPNPDFAYKPFIITGNDLVCRTKETVHKRKRQKPRRTFTKPKFNLAKQIFLRETNNNDCKEVIEAYIDKLPIITIDLIRHKFKDELESIVSFCKCWKSSVNPVTILVDLDQYEETKEKSFILLRPSVQKFEDLISVKVLFNIANCGFNESELLDINFDSLLNVVTFMQSRLRSGTGDKLLSLSNVVQLDGCMDEMRDVPRVARLDGVQYLYWHHSEWKNCEMTIADVASIVGECDQLTYSAEECAICHSVVADDDDIVMMSECKHRICDECLRVSVCQRLDSISDHVTCPVTDDGNNCSTRLDAVTILSVVSWRHYLRRLTMVLERSIVCGRPCHQCGATILLPSSSSSGQTVSEYLCVCSAGSVCALCGDKSHRPCTCMEMQAHDERMMAIVDVSLSGRCTQCKTSLHGHRRQRRRQCCAKCRASLTDIAVPHQDPRSTGLKLYNQSVYLGLLRRKDNLDRFKYDILGLESSAMVERGRTYSVDELASFYWQVLRILESMYVSAYHSYRWDNPRKLDQLKLATDQLLFFVGRIQSLSEEIGDCLVLVQPQHRHHRRSSGSSGSSGGGGGHSPSLYTCSKDHLKDKYRRLQGHIDSARLYAKKMMTLMKF